MTIGIIGVKVVGLYLALLVFCIIGVIAFAFYVVWTRAPRRGLRPSNEKLSWGEAWASQAIALGAVGLWTVEIAVLAFVGFFVLLLIFNPRNWLMAPALIVMFGILAAFFARLLVLRRRSNASAR